MRKAESNGSMPNRVTDLRLFAASKGIIMKSHKDIAAEMARREVKRARSISDIKERFDSIVLETEKEFYALYLLYEEKYGGAVIEEFVNHLREKGEITGLDDLGVVLSRHFKLLDRFFVSMGNARKSRAGTAFESIHNSLFKKLSYPFEEQVVINGKPDFLMPSAAYFRRNPIDCVIFTAKRTIRERWRQIVTEGTRGLGFYLATIDAKVSRKQLEEMLIHRIRLVVPEEIRDKYYTDEDNVLSFRQFFEEHLDPKVELWRKKGIII
jgi:hypothetical protein